MFKKSIMYHRYWYFKRRYHRRIHIFIRFVLIIIILALCVSYANRKLIPSLVSASESRLKSTLSLIISNAVNNTFLEDIKHGELVSVHKDNKGKVSSVEVNTVKLNLISAEIAGTIQRELDSAGKQKISVPLGALFGTGILSGIGPDLSISIVPCGNVKTEFFSDIDDSKVNKTIHRIYLNVKAEAGVVAPLFRRTVEVTTTIPIIETVIVENVHEIISSDDNKTDESPSL
ncbi:MAG TPA: sporulation protein YunB [Clostridiaceae bacterium]|nr:sporulation protein YunB [Clostridiaceae bacterium]